MHQHPSTPACVGGALGILEAPQAVPAAIVATSTHTRGGWGHMALSGSDLDFFVPHLHGCGLHARHTTATSARRRSEHRRWCKRTAPRMLLGCRRDHGLAYAMRLQASREAVARHAQAQAQQHDGEWLRQQARLHRAKSSK